MTRDRRQRLDRFRTRHLAELRGRTHRAIVHMNLGASGKLLHRLAELVDANGATWTGAASIAREMEYSETWIRVLLRRLRDDGYIQQVQHGGGCHRTSVYLLKIGAWRDDPRDPHMHAAFAERIKSTLRQWHDWLEGLFIAHHQHSARCWRFAPAHLKPPPEASAT